MDDCPCAGLAAGAVGHGVRAAACCHAADDTRARPDADSPSCNASGDGGAASGRDHACDLSRSRRHEARGTERYDSRSGCLGCIDSGSRTSG